MNYHSLRTIRRILRYAALAIGSAFFLTPFAWLLLTSVKDDRELAVTDLTSLVPKIPEKRDTSDPAAPAFRTTYREREVIVRPADPANPRLFEVVEPKAYRSQILERDPAALVPTSLALDVIRVRVPDGRSRVQDAHSNPSSREGLVLDDLPDGSVRARLGTGEVKVLGPESFERVYGVGLDLDNYPDALDFLPEAAERGILYLRNTLSLAFMAVIGTLLSSSLAAYAFARLHFRGRNVLFALLLSTLLLPAGVTLLPQFLIFRSLGWIDSLAPLWVPAFLGSAFNIFILRQFFASIPVELEDSARIDGCSPLRSYWSIMLPQVKPALVVIGIWTFMGAWNNFMGPLVYISSPENMPLSYALQLFQSERGGDPTLASAFVVMTILPVILVFFLAQKQIMENATLSGLGGR